MSAQLQVSNRCGAPASGTEAAGTGKPSSAAAWNHLRDGIRSLNPAYFAIDMATGIVAIALHLLGMEPLGRILAWINFAAYVILWGLTLIRLVNFSREMFSDLIDRNRGIGYFTRCSPLSLERSSFSSSMPRTDNRLFTLLLSPVICFTMQVREEERKAWRLLDHSPSPVL